MDDELRKAAQVVIGRWVASCRPIEIALAVHDLRTALAKNANAAPQDPRQAALEQVSRDCQWQASLEDAKDAAKYAFVLRLCAHISGCTVEQVDAQIVKVMSENKWEEL